MSLLTFFGAVAVIAAGGVAESVTIFAVGWLAGQSESFLERLDMSVMNKKTNKRSFLQMPVLVGMLLVCLFFLLFILLVEMPRTFHS